MRRGPGTVAHRAPGGHPIGASTDAAITIDYEPVTAELVNNGHTVQANVSPGSRIVVDDTSYELRQFHFHLPSEHTEDGETPRWRCTSSTRTRRATSPSSGSWSRRRETPPSRISFGRSRPRRARRWRSTSRSTSPSSCRTTATSTSRPCSPIATARGHVAQRDFRASAGVPGLGDSCVAHGGEVGVGLFDGFRVHLALGVLGRMGRLRLLRLPLPLLLGPTPPPAVHTRRTPRQLGPGQPQGR
ncbi:hypothetical protein E1265_08600 [Streptomyces sp. 8K308]|nr:hypothetical protein E1265_08600 [Streptomyces sp. 8K308]